MPLTKQLERRDGVIYVVDSKSGDLIIAVSEKFGLTDTKVMELVHDLCLHENGQETHEQCRLRLAEKICQREHAMVNFHEFHEPDNGMTYSERLAEVLSHA